MTIGEKIYNLRKAKNYSQEEVANHLNVSRQTVSKWETDQSTPDFDKIVPLCELFEISTDEFLKGETNISKKDDDGKDKKRNAIIVSVSIFLYFLAIIWIALAESMYIKEEITVAGFLFISGIATIMLIYNSLLSEKNYKETIEFTKKTNKKENKLKKSIIDALGIIFCIVYLAVSFITMAWHITWIIWLIYAFVIKIVDLLFMLGGKNGK